MAAINPSNDVDASEKTFETPKESVSSVKSVAPPKTPVTSGRKTERPVEPSHPYHAFTPKDQEEATIGNKELIFNLKVDGQLGVFYTRENATRIPTEIVMDSEAVFSSVRLTLYSAVERLILLGHHCELSQVTEVATNIAQSLAEGVMVMFYLKLRSTNYLDIRRDLQFYKKPKVPAPFEVPQPYALAISQLGQVKASGLATEVYVTPVCSQTYTGNFCLPDHITWTPVNYGRAVEYAKKIGMRFATVDLKVKMGSTWWLHSPTVDDGVFTLNCPLPEENFTESTAALHSLFCVNSAGGFLNPIFDLTPIGTAVYGSMLRAPPERIDLNTFFAIDESVEIIWKVS